jgi:hemolysin D
MSRLATLERHWSVLKLSWREQNERRAQARPRAEHEFLPAAQEIIEKPPSPGLRWLLLATCVFVVLALGWSFIGRVDVVAVASGKTVPAGSAKVVQPLEIGTVRAIHVRNGQLVHAGQLLLELDPTLATAEQAQSTQTLSNARVLQARNDALLAHLVGRPARFVAPSGTPPQVVRTEQQLVANAIAEYDAELASLRQQRAEKQADLAGTNAEIAKLTESRPFIEKQLAARRELTDKGYYSKLNLLEYEQSSNEQIRSIDVQTANAVRAQASIREIDAQVARLRGTFGKTAANDLAEASGKAGLASEELRKSERRSALQELRSPVDGVVQQLAVSTIGGVVQAAQPVMVIVPCASRGGVPDPSRCASSVEVEAMVQNRDIGFVKAGQRVAVKLEAFNFTDYGLVDGVVETLSRDAIDMGSKNPDSGAAGKPAGESGGLVYAARIRLLCDMRNPKRSPLCDRVQPGMAVQAEIKTGTRRIIQYLLSPLAKSVSEAGRER